MDLGGPPLELHALRLGSGLLDFHQVEVLLHLFIFNEPRLPVRRHDGQRRRRRVEFLVASDAPGQCL